MTPPGKPPIRPTKELAKGEGSLEWTLEERMMSISYDLEINYNNTGCVSFHLLLSPQEIRSTRTLGKLFLHEVNFLQAARESEGARDTSTSLTILQGRCVHFTAGGNINCWKVTAVSLTEHCPGTQQAAVFVHVLFRGRPVTSDWLLWGCKQQVLFYRVGLVWVAIPAAELPLGGQAPQLQPCFRSASPLHGSVFYTFLQM